MPGGIATGITDRKRPEQELLHNQEELHRRRAELEKLAAPLTIQDHGRQRIACNLHDDVSQRMAALLLDLVLFDQQPSTQSQWRIHTLLSIHTQLEQLFNDLHKLAHQLHPSLLMHQDPQAAVEHHIHRATARTDLRIQSRSTTFRHGSLSREGSSCSASSESPKRGEPCEGSGVTVKLVGSAKGVGLSGKEIKDNGKGFRSDETGAHHKLFTPDREEA